MATTRIVKPRNGIGAAKPKQVTILVGAAMALIDPPMPFLEQYLSYDRIGYERGGPLGYQEHTEQIPICGYDLRGRMGVPAGFVPRVVRILDEHGHKVELVDKRKFTQGFAIDNAFLNLRSDEERQFLEAVLHNPLGQIEVAGLRDMIAKTGMILGMYPDAHLLLPVGSKSHARKIIHTCQRYFDGIPMQLLGDQLPEKPVRCGVCTFSAMLTRPVTKYEIVLVLDPSGAIAKQNCRAMGTLLGPWDVEIHRVYAFVPAEVRLGRRGRLRLEGMAGPVIHRRNQQQVAVRVLRLPTPGCADIDMDCETLEFKRRAYWHNDRRNDYVAATARAFANLDKEKLRKYGVPFRDGEPAIRNSPQHVTMVVVGSTEQGREILKRLPGWKLFSATQGSNSEDANVANTEGLAGWIVTEMRASKGEIDVDVIIRAGGGTGNSCMQGLHMQTDVTAKEPVLLIDFTDKFDPRAQQDGELRRRDYELLGWEE